MTRKEAEKLAGDINKKEPQWFCPLINNMCRNDCVNFIMAFVDSENEDPKGMLHDVKDEDFVVEGHVCSNGMFIGMPPIGCH